LTKIEHFSKVSPGPKYAGLLEKIPEPRLKQIQRGTESKGLRVLHRTIARTTGRKGHGDLFGSDLLGGLRYFKGLGMGETPAPALSERELRLPPLFTKTTFRGLSLRERGFCFQETVFTDSPFVLGKGEKPHPEV